ncbi:imidazole glycerol phosphate synthase subunit HisH [Paracoccaceae bacterium]|nr:imidazole glycerol phosphate synthase subunit HisH [Paracoccaceae bacterium]
MEPNDSHVGIISYGCGNIRSVINSVQKNGYQASVIENPNQLNQFNTLILPGVGSFEFAMGQLHDRDFVAPIKDWVDYPNKKLIGICLGMQLLCICSEEASNNNIDGLGLIDARVEKLVAANYDRLPNIGWDEVEFTQQPFLVNSADYYFVHSYGVFCESPQNELAKTRYGDTTFSSAIRKENIYGFQFHPEKSHKVGQVLMSKVLSL